MRNLPRLASKATAIANTWPGLKRGFKKWNAASQMNDDGLALAELRVQMGAGAYQVALITEGGSIETCRVASIARVRELIAELHPESVRVHGDTLDERYALRAALNGQAH